MVDETTLALREIMASQEPAVEAVVEPAIETEPEVVEVAAEEIQAEEDIRTMVQLAEAIEVDAEYLYGIDVPMGDNLEAVPLGQLKDNYQNTMRENKSLQEQLKSQQEIIAKAEQGFTMGNQMSAEMTQAVGQMNEIQRQYQITDWAALEQSNPGEAALMRQKFQEAHNAAQGQIQQVTANQHQLQAQYMQHAGAKLMEIIPEWQDKTTREADQASIREMGIAAGYSPDVLAGISDPIAIKLARELMMLRKEKAEAQGAVAKVRSAPRVLAGVRGRQGGSQRTKDLVNAAKQATGSNKGASEVAAVKALLNMG